MMIERGESTDTLYTKVSALERDYDHLSSSLISFKNEVMGELRAIRTGQKPPNLLAFSGWASVLLAISIAIGALSMNPIQTRLTKAESAIDAIGYRTMENGWSKQDQIHFEANFRTNLEREVSLLDEGIQKERILNDDILRTSLGELKDRLKILEGVVHEHQKDGHPFLVLEKIHADRKRVDSLIK